MRAMSSARGASSHGSPILRWFSIACWTIQRRMIHPTALIEPGAVIGHDVAIGPYCVIGPNVTIGAGCRLHAHVNLAGHTTVGPRTVIYPFAALGGTPQHTGYRGGPTRLEIGADCVIRESVTMG